MRLVSCPSLVHGLLLDANVIVGDVAHRGETPQGDQRSVRTTCPFSRLLTSAESRSCLYSIEEIAKARDVSMAQVALAWVLAQPGITSPIVGSTRKEAIKELVQASHLELTDEEKEKISKPYRPRNILGHS